LFFSFFVSYFFYFDVTNKIRIHTHTFTVATVGYARHENKHKNKSKQNCTRAIKNKESTVVFYNAQKNIAGISMDKNNVEDSLLLCEYSS
jgi:hypothetical protein